MGLVLGSEYDEETAVLSFTRRLERYDVLSATPASTAERSIFKKSQKSASSESLSKTRIFEKGRGRARNVRGTDVM